MAEWVDLPNRQVGARETSIVLFHRSHLRQMSMMQFSSSRWINVLPWISMHRFELVRNAKRNTPTCCRQKQLRPRRTRVALKDALHELRCRKRRWHTDGHVAKPTRPLQPLAWRTFVMRLLRLLTILGCYGKRYSNCYIWHPRAHGLTARIRQLWLMVCVVSLSIKSSYSLTRSVRDFAHFKVISHRIPTSALHQFFPSWRRSHRMRWRSWSNLHYWKRQIISHNVHLTHEILRSGDDNNYSAHRQLIICFQ